MKFEGTKNAIVVAVAVSVGVLPMSFPALFAQFSGPLKLILESGIFLAAFTAVILNLLLNGTRSEASAETSPEPITPATSAEQRA